MEVIGLQIEPVDQDRPSFIPELLASVGARTSRSSGGLAEILQRIEGLDQQEAINQIFDWIDYGHRSIADMVPVAMYMTGITQLAAQFIWNTCQACAGQESSTRYLKKLNQFVEINEPTDRFSEISLKYQAEAHSMWENFFDQNPKEIQIPYNRDEQPKEYNRVLRNLVLDRSRVFLPMTGKTNVFLIQSSREWARVIKMLRSAGIEEFTQLGIKLRDELNALAPRMVKYCDPDENSRLIVGRKFRKGQFHENSWKPAHDNKLATIEIYEFITEEMLEDLAIIAKTRKNRYHEFGDDGVIPVKMHWRQAPLGEIRDLQRHRPGRRIVGTKRNGTYLGCINPLHPMAAGVTELYTRWQAEIQEHAPDVIAASPYGDILGGCYDFIYHTDLAHAIYMMELRTGPGGHFKYVDMMKSVWRKLPTPIKNMVQIGEGEPE